jgi:O-methyltransferase
LNIIQKIKKTLNAPPKPKITYNQDGLTTVHNNGFMNDVDFMNAESVGAATGSWHNIHWRVHTILWAANQCKNVEGDFVECGTNKGGFARSIVEYLDFIDIKKKFYLLDTFEGISEKLLTKEELATLKNVHLKNVYDSCYNEVKNTFANFPFVQIIKGTVPETLNLVTSEKIAFLSIDMNTIIPELATLNYFWDKLSLGGII